MDDSNLPKIVRNDHAAELQQASALSTPQVQVASSLSEPADWSGLGWGFFFMGVGTGRFGYVHIGLIPGMSFDASNIFLA
jgi:hypothetical protein